MAKEKSDTTGYTASDIEVLEGLEPVRKRPGMYIGGTDERAMHHLAGEILDNSMDEAVAGHADWIEIRLEPGNVLTITDNGRGIPVDKHPKFKKKSGLEVALTTLHSGGKFSNKAYATSGGLHGVGISVVNALSDFMSVEVAIDRTLYKQTYSRGIPQTKLKNMGSVHNRRGTSVTFHPDPEIFGEKMKFKPAWLYSMARSKAYLFSGVEVRWKCDPSLLAPDSKIKAEDVFRFPNGLLDFLDISIRDKQTVTSKPFYGKVDLPEKAGKVEFAIAWTEDLEGFTHSYCNTIPTSLGGTHETGLRSALMKGVRNYADMTGIKKASIITADDIIAGAAVLLSVFIRDPQFQGQTKEKLSTPGVTRLVDAAVRDYFDHWLSNDPSSSTKLVESFINRADERQRLKNDRVMARKTATQRLRLPGKLADCSRNNSDDTEIFIVEGDSAGGTAKMARNRETQAVMPLRGKILNVVSATRDKIQANQQIQDLVQALGCGSGKDFNYEKLRYERIIVMTDADVDGAHIASLLITFFYDQMKPLIERGHVFLARPPLYMITSGKQCVYTHDDLHKDELLGTVFKDKKTEIQRFKGLGEMMAAQLKETTMNPGNRVLLRVTLPDAMAALDLAGGPVEDEDMRDPMAEVDDLVKRLMGNNAEARFDFIQNNSKFVEEIDI
ncbi:MAG: DNA topoisomerase IV subunit B [Rhodospirillales bacterium]|nr:DNA topoisomerase IV subunit B [Rhodospirillales bacterium]